MLDLLFKNVSVVDGTGATAYRGNVGAFEGKIVLAKEEDSAGQVVDGSGLTLCPGFIDVHSHGDIVLGHDYAKLCKVSQGITTEVGGQCGSSMFPVQAEHIEELKGLLSVCTLTFPDEFNQFTSFERYSHYVDGLGLAANVKILLGHGSLRVSVMGYQNRPSTSDEMARMKDRVREAMEHGAMGLSSGLIYSPSCYASTEELIELSKVVGEYGGVYATHMRSESNDVVGSVKEALRIGKEAGVPVFISHHKVQGRKNWGRSTQTLELIAQARAQGQMVTADQYPYLASMTHLNAAIPPKYFADGIGGVGKLAADPAIRAQIKAEIMSPDTPFENQYLNCGGWANIQISSLPKTPQYDGMTVAEVAQARGQDEFEAYFDLLAENGGVGNAIYFCMGEEDLCRIFMAPDTVVGTDGLLRAWGEKVHPRAWGTFPHAICYFHKEKKLLSLEEMIRKITLLPAERAMLKNKGAVKEGWDADLVIFDYNKLEDKADFKNPNELTQGIEYVVVGGKVVYHDGKLTGENPGRLIRHSRD